MSNWKDRLIIYGMIIFTFSFVVNTSKNILRFLSLQREMALQEERLKELENKNEQLKKQLITFDDRTKEALVRDQLGLVKQGETVIFLPQTAVEEKNQLINQAAGETKVAVWQKWLNLFLRPASLPDA